MCMARLFNKQGFLQALGVFIYCSLIGLFMGSAESIFGKIDIPLGPILLLLIFSTSALICGVLVLYKPYKVFVEGKKKEALTIVISTSVWLFVFSLLFLLTLAVFK